MRFAVRSPDIKRQLETAKREWRRDHEKAAHVATDRASKDAQREIQTKMRSVRLGRLANAVGQTSSLKKRQRDRTPYGAIYARGGDESRGGQALEAYSQGATIRPGPGKSWLAYPTPAAKRLIRLPTVRKGKPGFANFRRTAGNNGQKLDFIQFSPSRAALVLKKAEVSIRTGIARPQGKRKSRAYNRKDFVIIFWLIRETVRAQRFDPKVHVSRAHRNMPRFLVEALAAAKVT